MLHQREQLTPLLSLHKHRRSTAQRKNAFKKDQRWSNHLQSYFVQNYQRNVKNNMESLKRVNSFCSIESDFILCATSKSYKNTPERPAHGTAPRLWPRGPARWAEKAGSSPDLATGSPTSASGWDPQTGPNAECFWREKWGFFSPMSRAYLKEGGLVYVFFFLRFIFV